MLNDPGKTPSGCTPVLDCHIACKFSVIKAKVDRGSGKATKENTTIKELLINCKYYNKKCILAARAGAKFLVVCSALVLRCRSFRFSSFSFTSAIVLVRAPLYSTLAMVTE